MADAHIIWKEREVRLKTYYNSGHLWEGEPFYFLKYSQFKDKIPYCFRCGKHIDDRFMNFCPNCGAKLDKEDENDQSND